MAEPQQISSKRIHSSMSEYQQISSKMLKLSSIEDNNGSTFDDEDRISSLPDSILADILSLLDIHSAVATSVLSRRWRYLWNQVTHFDIDYDDFDEHLSVSEHSTTVDHILRQCSSPKISSCLLCISKPSLEEEFETIERYIISWITLICARFPDELKIDVFNSGMPLIPLPIHVFETVSLSKLEFSGPFVCEFPDNSAINLPNLKALVLNYTQITPDLISKLTKSCPLLEYLDLHLEWLENYAVVMNISVPNLKSLVVFLSGDEQWKHCKFVIDAPKLERVNLQGYFACYHFVNNRTTLIRATLGFDHSTFKVGSDHLSYVAKLLQEISSVQSIHLVNGLEMFNPINYVVANAWKVFRNLTRICLISASLHQVMYSDSPIPGCLLAKVNWMKLDDLKGDEYDMTLLEYILSKAEVLEKILVDVSTVDYIEGSLQYQVWWELNFCKRLFELSRKSSTCEIKFSGSFLDSSSKDYNDGSIAGRIEWGF